MRDVYFFPSICLANIYSKAQTFRVHNGQRLQAFLRVASTEVICLQNADGTIGIELGSFEEG